MTSVLTITVNPAIDVSTSTEHVVPTRKLRCTVPRRDPGGGGINVARVIRRLGSEVTALYPAGGSIGQLLRRLLDNERVPSIAVAIADDTREDLTVLERQTGQQYRFVLPGPLLAEPEWRSCLAALEAIEDFAPWVVASGSLPPGVPDEFYARVARIVKARGSKVVVDTSGNALAAALDEGVYLVKPSLRELREYMKTPLADQAACLGAGRWLIERGAAEVVALTLGDQGALLVTRDGAHLARAPEIRAASVVGAGDSFVGAMVWRLAAGGSVTDAFRYGVAAGSAAVLNAGTELCHASDVLRIYPQIELIPS
jgi:6-phosphofructokinase 2